MGSNINSWDLVTICQAVANIIHALALLYYLHIHVVCKGPEPTSLNKQLYCIVQLSVHFNCSFNPVLDMKQGLFLAQIQTNIYYRYFFYMKQDDDTET